MQRLRNHQDVTEQDGGVQVVPPQGLQRHLRNVSRVGQQLQEVLALGLLVRLVLWQVPSSLTEQPEVNHRGVRRRRHCCAVAHLVSTPSCHARALASLRPVQPRWQVHCCCADATCRVLGFASAGAQGSIAAAVIQARREAKRPLSEAHAPHRRLFHMLAPSGAQHEVVGRHGVGACSCCDCARSRPCAPAAGAPAAPCMPGSAGGQRPRHRHGGTGENAVRRTAQNVCASLRQVA